MPRIDYFSPVAAVNGLTAAGRQLKAWWSTGWDNSETPPGLYSRLSLFSFGVFCLNVLALLYFYLVAGYEQLAIDEKSPAELLTVALFGGSSLTLFLAAGAAGRGWLRRLYILAGLGALFVAGEELSWGQHIFGFPFPDFLEETNIQQDTSLHNYTYFDAFFHYLYIAPILLSVTTVAAFILRKYHLGPLPLPSLWLALFLALTASFSNGASLPRVIAWEGQPLLLILGIFLGVALFSRDKRLLMVVATITVLSCALFFLHSKYILYSWDKTLHNELREYLIGLTAFLYSLQLLRDSGGERWLAYGRRVKAYWFPPRGPRCRGHPSLTPPPIWQYHSWRWAWPAVCLAVALSSIGLVLFERQVAAGLKQELSELIASPPTASAHSWNIYYRPGRLTYARDGACPEIAELRDAPFFLHIIPVRETDLPVELREIGIANADFGFRSRAESYLYQYQGCTNTIELPDYPIAQIYTGQMVEEPGPAGPAGDNAETGNLWRQLWEVQLDLDADYYRAEYQTIAAGQAGPPLARSVFDLYRYDNALYYFRESCAAADTADRFLLHIFPIRVDDLPAERQPFRFSNLDFDFNRRGHWFDGKCLAVVELPDYPIAEIRTGQQVDGIAAWEIGVNLAAEYYRDAYQSIAAGQAGEPAARAVFDLYRRDNALYYFKESCAAADTDARFFLHLIPENPENLPAAARNLGFANRDFPFVRRGQRFDGKCLAVAELPDYPIAEIRTGQFTAAGTVWEVVLPAEN